MYATIIGIFPKATFANGIEITIVSHQEAFLCTPYHTHYFLGLCVEHDAGVCLHGQEAAVRRETHGFAPVGGPDVVGLLSVGAFGNQYLRGIDVCTIEAHDALLFELHIDVCTITARTDNLCTVALFLGNNKI